jgi:hypothetical protein
LINAHRHDGRGRTFSVAWMRKTTSDDGEREIDVQEVVCGRFNVRKHLKSVTQGFSPGPAYDRHEKKLFCIFVTSRKYNGRSCNVRGYRSIPFDRITWLKLDGVTYKVSHRAPTPQR